MVNGAIINAASFDGKNDLAVEKYQAAYEKYRAHRTKFSVEKQPMIVLKIRQNKISRKLTMS